MGYFASLKTIVLTDGSYQGDCGFHLHDDEGNDLLDTGCYAPQEIPSEPHEIVRAFFAQGYNDTIDRVLEHIEIRGASLKVNDAYLESEEILALAAEAGLR